jgi:hypothetical protein
MIQPFPSREENSIVTEWLPRRLSVGVQIEKLGLRHRDSVGVAGCRTQESKPFPNAPAIKRLDGSMFTAAEIDGTVTRLMNVAKVTGAGIAILNDGKMVYLKTYGFRDLKKSRPLTPDSVMSAASFTKVVFAYMVMQLVQEGVLDLDNRFTNACPSPCANRAAIPIWPAMSATRKSRRACCLITRADFRIGADLTTTESCISILSQAPGLPIREKESPFSN